MTSHGELLENPGVNERESPVTGNPPVTDRPKYYIIDKEYDLQELITYFSYYQHYFQSKSESIYFALLSQKFFIYFSREYFKKNHEFIHKEEKRKCLRPSQFYLDCIIYLRSNKVFDNLR